MNKKDYYQANRKECDDRTKAWVKSNPEKRKAICKKYYKTHKEAHKKTVKACFEANPEKYKATKTAWRKANPEKVNNTARKHYSANKEKINAKKKQRWKTDPNFALNHNISEVIRYSLKGNKNGNHWEKLVGYSLEQLKEHLEKQFKPGMTWENYGPVWHVDHIIPISVFNFTKPEHEDFKKCWALKNLQPLWAKDNIIKSNKIDKHFQPSLLL